MLTINPKGVAHLTREAPLKSTTMNTIPEPLTQHQRRLQAYLKETSELMHKETGQERIGWKYCSFEEALLDIGFNP